MVQRVSSKLVKHEGQILHTLLESILTRLTALEAPFMSLEEDTEVGTKVEGLDAGFGVPTFLPAYTD